MTLIFTRSAESELRELYSDCSRSVKNEITTLLSTLDDAPEYALSESDAVPAAADEPETRPPGAGSTQRSIVRAGGGIVWVLWRERGEGVIEIVGAIRVE